MLHPSPWQPLSCSLLPWVWLLILLQFPHRSDNSLPTVRPQHAERTGDPKEALRPWRHGLKAWTPLQGPRPAAYTLRWHLGTVWKRAEVDSRTPSVALSRAVARRIHTCSSQVHGPRPPASRTGTHRTDIVLVSSAESGLPSPRASGASAGGSGAQAPYTSGAAATPGKGTGPPPRSRLTSSSSLFFSSSKRARSSDRDSIKSAAPGGRERYNHWVWHGTNNAALGSVTDLCPALAAASCFSACHWDHWLCSLFSFSLLLKQY